MYRKILIVTIDNDRIESTKNITSMITFIINNDILSRVLFLVTRRDYVKIISHVLKIRTSMDLQDL